MVLSARFLQALDVVDAARSAAAAAPPDWCDTALAQAGLLLLLECRFREAFSALSRCSPAAFQPAGLLQLFPRYAQRYRAHAAVKPYWGLHGECLPPLDKLVDDFLELQEATRGSLDHLAAAAQEELLAAAPPLETAGASGSGGSRTTGDPVPGRDSAPESQAGAPAAAPAAAGHDALAETFIAAAQRQLLTLLLQARQRPGVACPQGLDSLLINLFCATGDAGGLEAFVLSDPAAPSSEAADTMRAAGRCGGGACTLSMAE